MRIHYLGHAAFVLRFENGVSVLMDYGVSNAYGLTSPIFDVSGADPSIVTFSHDHPDHRRSDLPFSKSRILSGGGTLAGDGLSIRPIRTSEVAMEIADNAGFVINYGGFTILHLADAQAFICAIDDPVVKRRVRAQYPDNYDLVLMTIDGAASMVAQAATFLDLLAPARAIPMHYWSSETKADFLTELMTLNGEGRGRRDRFTIAETGCSDFSLYADSPPFGTRVISMEPAPLTLCPEDSRAPDGDLTHVSERAAAAGSSESVRPAIAAGPPLSAAAVPWRRASGSALPARRPVAAAPCHGFAAASPVLRRATSATLAPRAHSPVGVRTGNDLD